MLNYCAAALIVTSQRVEIHSPKCFIHGCCDRHARAALIYVSIYENQIVTQWVIFCDSYRVYLTETCVLHYHSFQKKYGLLFRVLKFKVIIIINCDWNMIVHFLLIKSIQPCLAR